MAETQTAEPEADDLPTGEAEVETTDEPFDPAADVEPPAEAEDPEVPIVEDAKGQLHIGGPGTEPRFTTDAGGNPPEEVEIKIGSTKFEWGEDIHRHQDFLFLSHVKIGDVVVGDKKVGNAAVVNIVEFPSHMQPREAVMAVHDLQSRKTLDKRVIDQLADIAAHIVDDEAPESGVDLAYMIRERMYERFHIEGDPREEVEVEIAPEDDPEWEAAEPVVDGDPSSLTDVPEADKLAARERDLEKRIADAVAEGDTEAQEALRDELERVRLAQNPELAWNEDK